MAATVAIETAPFAGGGNVAPLGHLVWILPGLAAGVAAASAAAPFAVILVLFVAGGGGN